MCDACVCACMCVCVFITYRSSFVGGHTAVNGQEEDRKEVEDENAGIESRFLSDQASAPYGQPQQYK